MNEPQPKQKAPLEEIKARFAEVQVNIYRLLYEFVCWNDVMRYPDLPTDSERPGRRAGAERNAMNESQIRYLASAKEDSIILNLWALLYDDGRDSRSNLQRLCRDLNDPRYFPDRQSAKSLNDCRRYLNRDGFRNRFDLHRNNFIAHISSVQPSTENIVDYSDMYRVVPKTIHLIELLNGDLGGNPLYFDNQFIGVASEVAGFFSHSQPDALLAELFKNRSVSSDEFETAVGRFLKVYIERERADRLT